MNAQDSGSRWMRLFVIGLLVTWTFACGADDAALVESIGPEAALAQLRGDAPPLFLDVRTPAEYEKAHIPGSLNVPHTEVAARIDEIRAEDSGEVIVYCERGVRARSARKDLEAAGITDIAYLAGDMRTWRSRQLPTVSGKARGSLAD